MRNSSTSGKTLTLVLLRWRMRRRGWLGWRASKQRPPLSENSTYLHFQQEIHITIWPKPSSISVLTKTVHICAIFEWKQGILVVIQTHIPPGGNQHKIRISSMYFPGYMLKFSIIFCPDRISQFPGFFHSHISALLGIGSQKLSHFFRIFFEEF